MLTRALVLTAAAVLLAGCNGGTVDRHALTNDSADGRFDRLRGSASGARRRAREDDRVLRARAGGGARIQASNLADALASRPALASIERKVRAKAKDAARLAADAAAPARSSVRPSGRRGRRTAAEAARRLRVSKILGLALGILAAIGGFVDIGDLVFNTAAGATFGYQLMWVIPIGVVGIIVYSEMCGRVAAVSGKAVFDAMRERVGFKAALGALVSSEIVNLMTLACELGGVAIALQLLSGLPYRWLILVAVLAFVVIIWVTAFEWIERIFGYGGLCMLVFAVAAVKLGPGLGEGRAAGSSRTSRRTTRRSTSTSSSACSARR